MKPAPLLFDPVARAARFADGLFAWWRPAAGKAPAAALGEERKAMHRWEDEGGNTK